MRRTKIVATIGPASHSPEMLAQLIESGVDVFRLNFSHGTHDAHAEVYTRVRAASRQGRTHRRRHAGSEWAEDQDDSAGGRHPDHPRGRQ